MTASAIGVSSWSSSGVLDVASGSCQAVAGVIARAIMEEIAPANKWKISVEGVALRILVALCHANFHIGLPTQTAVMAMGTTARAAIPDTLVIRRRPGSGRKRADS